MRNSVGRLPIDRESTALFSWSMVRCLHRLEVTLLIGRVALAAIALVWITGCSSRATPAVPAAPTVAAAQPPLLDLCQLPALAPADLRSKPGYVEFAVSTVDANGAPASGLKQSDFTVS